MRVASLILVLPIAALCGCQRLNVEKSLTLPATSTQPLEFDAPRNAQALSVSVKPAAGPIAAYLCTKDNQDAVDRALTFEKEPPKQAVLGGGRGKAAGEEIRFEATVPAKTEFVLLLHNPGKETTVKVLVTGR